MHGKLHHFGSISHLLARQRMRCASRPRPLFPTWQRGFSMLKKIDDVLIYQTAATIPATEVKQLYSADQ